MMSKLLAYLLLLASIAFATFAGRTDANDGEFGVVGNPMAIESWQVYIVREILGLKTKSYDGLFLSWENMHLQAQKIRAFWTQTKTQTHEREKLANDNNNNADNADNADNAIRLRHSRHLVDQKQNQQDQQDQQTHNKKQEQRNQLGQNLTRSLTHFAVFPPCLLGEDTIGKWVDLDKDLHTNETSETSESVSNIELRRHFYHGRYHAATEFSKIWLPDRCAYHRFTSAAIERSVDYYINNPGLKTRGGRSFNNVTITVMLFGDSITRGLMCSLNRLINGTEALGPLDSACVPGEEYLRYQYFNGKLEIIWQFSRSFVRHRPDITIKHVEDALELIPAPFAVMLNTGAWDFQPHPMAAPRKQMGNENCFTELEEAQSEERYSNDIRDIYESLSTMATATSPDRQVSLIYRNMHYNSRYPSLCVDKKVEEMLIKYTNFTITDTRSVSQSVFLEQEIDGLHYDRQYSFTEKEHELGREAAAAAAAKDNKQLPGMLEMQLAQSFLNHLFHDSLHVHHHVDWHGEEQEQAKIQAHAQAHSKAQVAVGPKEGQKS